MPRALDRVLDLDLQANKELSSEITWPQLQQREIQAGNTDAEFFPPLCLKGKGTLLCSWRTSSWKDNQ